MEDDPGQNGKLDRLDMQANQSNVNEIVFDGCKLDCWRYKLANRMEGRCSGSTLWYQLI